MAQNRLSRKTLSRVALRSFLLQASWNFEGLQSLGFLYVVAPVLRSLYQGEELAAAFQRHLEYFNTHPFLASPALGTTLALEEGGGPDEGVPAVEEFKGLVMAPYAAMGDALFWGGLRPLAAVIGVFFALRGSLWAPVVFLLLFNAPHLWFRIVALWRGYRLGEGMVAEIQRWHLPDLAMRLKALTVVLLGALSAYLTFLGLRSEGVAPPWGLLALPLVLLLGWLARKGGSALVMTLSLTALILTFC